MVYFCDSDSTTPLKVNRPQTNRITGGDEFFFSSLLGFFESCLRIIASFSMYLMYFSRTDTRSS